MVKACYSLPHQRVTVCPSSRQSSLTSVDQVQWCNRRLFIYYVSYSWFILIKFQSEVIGSKLSVGGQLIKNVHHQRPSYHSWQFGNFRVGVKLRFWQIQPWPIPCKTVHSNVRGRGNTVEQLAFLSPVNTSDNVEATLSNATSGTILSTKWNVASTKSNVASTLLLVWTGF